MKTKLLFLFLCVFSTAGSFAAEADSAHDTKVTEVAAGVATSESSNSIDNASPAYEILTEDCVAYSVAHATETFEKINAVRASIQDQVLTGGHANSVNGYFILSALFSENPYKGMAKLESGTKRLLKNKKPTRSQQIIMQTYCQNGHDLSMHLLTMNP